VRQHLFWVVFFCEQVLCREVAALFYLNEPSGGKGETLFLSPVRRAVPPRKGAVLLFPAAPTHLHAGAPPGAGGTPK
jgi:hypothetical protein